MLRVSAVMVLCIPSIFCLQDMYSKLHMLFSVMSDRLEQRQLVSPEPLCWLLIRVCLSSEDARRDPLVRRMAEAMRTAGLTMADTLREMLPPTDAGMYMPRDALYHDFWYVCDNIRLYFIATKYSNLISCDHCVFTVIQFLEANIKINIVSVQKIYIF